MAYERSSSEFERMDVFKSCLAGAFSLSVKGCSSFWCLGVGHEGRLEGSKGAGGFYVERRLVGFHGMILSILSFSLVLSLFISLRF